MFTAGQAGRNGTVRFWNDQVRVRWRLHRDTSTGDPTRADNLPGSDRCGGAAAEARHRDSWYHPRPQWPVRRR